jgi:hypothetical protein
MDTGTVFYEAGVREGEEAVRFLRCYLFHSALSITYQTSIMRLMREVGVCKKLPCYCYCFLGRELSLGMVKTKSSVKFSSLEQFQGKAFHEVRRNLSVFVRMRRD